MAQLIETHDLSKSFGDFQAVDGISIAVRAGEVMALLGPNGAGKTTTIRMLASILKPTRGWARIAGQDVVANPQEVRSSIGMLTEHHGLYTRMCADEYLAYFGRIYGMSADQANRRMDALLDQLQLSEERRRRLGEFSKGMRQKLSLARVLLHDPPILLLDEPTSAMDPASAKLVRESILGLRNSSRAIIICTHNLIEAETLADRIAIIQRGKIVALGSSAQLKMRFLGSPKMRIVLNAPLNGLKPSLPEGVSSVQYGLNWIEYETAQPKVVNPQVLQSLMTAGFGVVTLSEVGQNLEEVYLNVVDAHLQDGNWR